MKLFIALTIVLSLTACGGGSSTASKIVTEDQNSQSFQQGPSQQASTQQEQQNSSVSDNTPTSIGNWAAGVYQSSRTFANRCADPRANSNYQDILGTVTDENNWIRSWSHETYLWYNELPDIDPETLSDPIAYFNQMKTPAKTASGRDKDQFHFTYNTEEYNRLAQSGISVSYGASFKIINATTPRIIVTYTEANSPAAEANIIRGAEVLAIDGVYLNNISSDQDAEIINRGAFPDKIGEMHSFVIRDRNAINPRTLQLTSKEVTEIPVYQTKVITQNGKKIGYLVLNTFGVATAEQQLIDAVNSLKQQNIDELILDLRYNGGGYLNISAELATMIAGDNALGSIFNAIIYNDKRSIYNENFRFPSAAFGFSAIQGSNLPKLNLSKVYILSTSNTASASESLINGLRGVDMEVVLIGENTRGKPYGFLPRDNCGTTYFTIQFKGTNAKGYGDYADGFIPSVADNGEDRVRGCRVSDDLSRELGDSNENMLATALHFIENDSCPSTAINRLSKSANPLHSVKGELLRPFPMGTIVQ